MEQAGFVLKWDFFCWKFCVFFGIFMWLRLCLLTFCFLLFMFCDRCSLPFWHQSVCVRIWHHGSTFLVLRSFVSAADSLFISWNLRGKSHVRDKIRMERWEVGMSKGKSESYIPIEFVLFILLLGDFFCVCVCEY